MVLTKPKTYVSCASVQQSCPTALKTGLQCLHVRKRNTSQKRCINKLVGDEVAVSTLMQCPLFSTVIFTTKITQIHNLSALKRHVTASSSLLACNSRLRSTIRRHNAVFQAVSAWKTLMWCPNGKYKSLVSPLKQMPAPVPSTPPEPSGPSGGWNRVVIVI